ncbi:subtilisin-like protease 4 [Zingiber officinale]|uniref:subtilisin-like protease 4 n=1 Tax=Zingiber officinale TaxID=94328 RepID=UPI001C4CB97B|nr:subtilisin-like protease 4 [Zingiber officinale]
MTIHFFFLCVSVLLAGFGAAYSDEELKAYIVYVDIPPPVSAYDSIDYNSLLKNVAGTLEIEEDDAASRVIHSYRNVMTGFSAMLTEREVAAMSKVDWFVRAVPSSVYRPLTTHTPRFLGLRHRTHSVWNITDMGEGVIIGLLDTGVTPGHPSFDDHGIPPPPAKWKGRCDFGNTSLTKQFCNNKLIGVRSFVNYDRSRHRSTVSPIDNDGHGTHTASTAGGAFVKHANVYGLARGLAAGVAPHAHVAMYKVCTDEGCQSYDILAGMDAAVEDGVDVLSISLGGYVPTPFYDDSVSIGGFHAMSRGIFVSCAAGNSGPYHSTVVNDAPWLLTVAASTMDRSFSATVKLGDGRQFRGQSLYQPRGFSPKKKYPLVLLDGRGRFCLEGSLDGVNVKGKIVFCDRGGDPTVPLDEVVKQAGAAGMVLPNYDLDGYSTYANLLTVPASNIPYAAGLDIKAYINSTARPTASIMFSGAVTHMPRSPAITSFSSRGPSLITPGILKPDITGPGVNVLAAWNTEKFKVISGTSMSCPHLSGVVALIKKAHPDWSPAAIKSAIMTTAYVKDNTNKPISDETNLPADLFALGAGHVKPLKVLDPGLVYDNSPEDYYPYLCGLGYSDYQIRSIVNRKINCSSIKSIQEGDLNYPSITVQLTTDPKRTVSFIRTVTNVGQSPATYYAKVKVPKFVSAVVVPRSLTFERVNEKKSFKISFKRRGRLGARTPPVIEGQLRWVSPARPVVRSPISILLK